MKRASRVSPALVISVIALFVALGTGAYAVSKIPKASVGTKQLKKKAVGSKQLKKKAVKTKNIAGGAVTAEKIADGVIPDIPTVPQQPIVFAAKHVSPSIPAQGTLLQRQINVPRAGFLYLVASGDAELGGDDFINCAIAIDGDTDAASSRLVGDNPNSSDNCSTNTVVQVGAGSHFISFEGSSADPGATYGEMTLQAIFIPAGSITGP